MLKILLLLGLPVALLSAAPASRYPEGYWERSYSSGNMSSVQYNIKLKVEDIEKAQGEVQRMLTEAGATLSGNAWGGSYGNAKSDRTVNFAIEARKAEQAAKKLFAVGELQSYNTYRHVDKKTLTEIGKKIEELTAEITANQKALQKMPIADHFLNSQLKKLKQSRDSISAGLDRAMLVITLTQAETNS
jgi:hypothetical protein